MNNTRTGKPARKGNGAAGAPTMVGTHGTRGDALPRESVQGSVHYISGGSALRQAIAIRHAMHRYPLTLEFRYKENGREHFLPEVAVTIRAAGGETVFRSPSAGPFLLAKLRPGKYEVVAERQGSAQRREVQVRANGGEHLVFEWTAPHGGAAPAPGVPGRRDNG